MPVPVAERREPREGDGLAAMQATPRTRAMELASRISRDTSELLKLCEVNREPLRNLVTTIARSAAYDALQEHEGRLLWKVIRRVGADTTMDLAAEVAGEAFDRLFPPDGRE